MTDATHAGLDPLFVQGIELFNAGEFFACHEVLEEFWQRISGDDKRFTQAIIQIAVAYYHLERGNSAGAGRLFVRALAKLDKAATNCHLAKSLNTLPLIKHVRAQSEYLSALPAGAKVERERILPPALTLGR